MAHKRKAKKNIRCIVYLATVADENTVDRKEQKQLRYIREYAKAHQLQIVKVFHRSILGSGGHEQALSEHCKTDPKWGSRSNFAGKYGNDLPKSAGCIW